jgi:mono/diheme cytochrome c family protein
MLGARFTIRVFFGTLLFGFTALAADVTAGLVTFQKDVLPILQTHCQSCHRPGEAGPMSFLTYQTTRPWAKAMKAAIITGKMPPWGVDPEHGHFQNDPSLKPEEVAIISRWADTGAAEGNAKDAPAPVKWVEGWKSKPDVFVSLPPFDVPAKGSVEWMNMVIPSPFKEDTWITSLEVHPGNTAVMHHVGVSFIPHRDDVKYGELVWEDIKRDANGYELQGQARPSLVTYCPGDKTKICPATGSSLAIGRARNGFEGFYRPGSDPINYAYYDSAYKIPGNTDILVQVHYSPNGKAVTDVTKVGFTLQKGEPRHQLKMYPFGPAGGTNNRTTFRIPAGDPNWEAPPADTVFNMDAELALFSVHMHERGKAMKFTLTYPDGTSEVVFNISHYDFNWQFYYNLIETKKVPKGTKLHIEAWYDNSANNPNNRDPTVDIYGGEQSWEEMMTPWIGLVLDTKTDPRTVLGNGGRGRGGNPGGGPGGRGAPPAPGRAGAGAH